MSTSNFQRKKTDYIWIAGFFAATYAVGQRLGSFSSADDSAALLKAMDPFGIQDPILVQCVFFFFTAFGMSGMTAATWLVIRRLQPDLPTKHVKDQLKTIAPNLLFVLPVYQSVLNYLMVAGYTKATVRLSGPLQVITDVALWMWVFELCWYTQHRLMHDNYYLWKYGHEYHHGWKRKEHMIGITNFAFDHVVEGWVTMSSSFVPMVLFPLNYHVAVTIGLLYMILAVLVHWDGFPIKYHLNHHYAVVKNYGSHVPLFDMFFNTYKPAYFQLAPTVDEKNVEAPTMDAAKADAKSK